MINIPLLKNQQSIVPQTNIKDIAENFIVGFMAQKYRKKSGNREKIEKNNLMCSVNLSD
jgi:hypothetical protein